MYLSEKALRKSSLPSKLSYREGISSGNNYEQTHVSTNDGGLKGTNPSPTEVKKRNRNRKVTWFNPPFSRNLKTNLAKEFLQLIDKKFPKDNPLSKIINRRTIKVSYSYTANMASVISAYNQQILKEKTTEITALPCKCRNECIRRRGRTWLNVH